MCPCRWHPRLFISCSPRGPDNNQASDLTAIRSLPGGRRELCASRFRPPPLAVPFSALLPFCPMNQSSTASSEPALSLSIEKLEHDLEQLRQNELRRFLKKTSPTTASLLDEATKSLMQQVLRQRVGQLRAVCQHGGGSQLVALLTELFDLESPAVGLAG